MTDRCPATARTGERCKLPAGWGTDHNGHGLCRFHGGCSPGGRKQAERLAAEDAVATLGLPRDIEPHVALEEELWRTAGHVEWLGAEVAKLPAQRVTGSPLLSLYERERRHLLQVSRTALDVGLEERRVRIVEQVGEAVATALRGVLTELGVPLDDPRTQEIVVRHLRALEAAA